MDTYSWKKRMALQLEATSSMVQEDEKDKAWKSEKKVLKLEFRIKGIQPFKNLIP